MLSPVHQPSQSPDAVTTTAEPSKSPPRKKKKSSNNPLLDEADSKPVRTSWVHTLEDDGKEYSVTVEKVDSSRIRVKPTNKDLQFNNYTNFKSYITNNKNKAFFADKQKGSLDTLWNINTPSTTPSTTHRGV